MSEFQPVFTDAGRAASASAGGLGLSTEITHVSMGTGTYEVVDSGGQPTAAGTSATALREEKLRVPAYSGGPTAPGALDIVAEVTKAGEGDEQFYITEIGFWHNDVLVSVWSSTATNLGYRGNLGSWYLSMGLAWVDLPGDAFTVQVLNGPLAEQMVRQAQVRAQVKDLAEQSGVEYIDDDPTVLSRALSAQVDNIVSALDKKVRPPVCVNPPSGAAAVVLSPVLQGSSYFSADGYSHTASQFVVLNADRTVLYDSGTLGAVESHNVPPAQLSILTDYLWRVRYQGTLGGDVIWSDWSAEVPFTTADTYVNAPSILTPADAATDIAEQPVLTTSAFAVTNGVDGHDKTQYQIATDGAFGNIVWDSGASSDLTQTTVPAGILSDGTTTYYARVRHIGATLGSSVWSQPISFTTVGVFAYIPKPVASLPTGGAAGIALQPVLTAASWAVVPTNYDTHDASQFQVATDSGFVNLVWDSGVDNSNLESVQVGIALELGTQYYWRVRFRGASLGWSDWADGAMFHTRVMELPQNVFSVNLYNGNGVSQPITNGIDLATEGGLVWAKLRSLASANYLWNSVTDSFLSSDEPKSENYAGSIPLQTNEDGFSVLTGSNLYNQSGLPYVAWSFRRAPRFLDLVTWQGDGEATRKILHGLGVKPGLILVKRTDSGGYNWIVYHRSLGSGQHLLLNVGGNPASNSDWFRQAEPTESEFTVGKSNVSLNDSGGDYIAFVFAHDSDTNGTIQCGEYDATGSNMQIDLGWPAQFVMVKCATASYGWAMYDSQRGGVIGDIKRLRADTNAAEATQGTGIAFDNPDGFTATGGDGHVNLAGKKYVYLAIRAPIPV